MIDLLKRLFGISAEVTGESLRAHMMRVLEHKGLVTESNLPYLLNLFGLPVPDLESVDSSIVGLRIRAAIAEVIRNVAAQSPTLVFFNDCHWIDHSSEVLLSDLIDMATENVLIICTYRPEYKPSWGDRSIAREVILSPLSTSDLRVLVSAQLEGRDFSESAARRLLEQCNGNPLFAEELARHMRRSEGDPKVPTGKIDAPSGTARELANRLSNVQESQLDVPLEMMEGPRESRGVRLHGSQVHSIRVPGYTISIETIFGMPDQKLILRHESGSSAVPYVDGALLAIRKVGKLVGVQRGLDSVMEF